MKPTHHYTPNGDRIPIKDIAIMFNAKYIRMDGEYFTVPEEWREGKDE